MTRYLVSILLRSSGFNTQAAPSVSWRKRFGLDRFDSVSASITTTTNTTTTTATTNNNTNDNEHDHINDNNNMWVYVCYVNNM